jgi:hypothetical protein
MANCDAIGNPRIQHPVRRRVRPKIGGRVPSLRRTAALLAAAALAVVLGGLAGAPAMADPGGNGKGSGKGGTTATAGKGRSDHSAGNRGTSGDPTQPQPPSNADFSGHGANRHGAYDSTRDGSPSLNGNGGGEANGKPCAGCVGRADNKNPPGQAPDGRDHNAGYECDRNSGVGRGNPAHAGCREAPPTSPPTGPPTSPQPSHGKPPGAQPPGGGLPTTGTALGGTLAFALALLAGGATLRLVARRRPNS